MSSFKKSVSVLVVLLIVLLCFVGCKSDGEKVTPTAEPTKKIDINIATLKGPTGMGMIKVVDDASNKLTANNYNFTFETDPTEISAQLINGSIDIAAIPTNLALNLFNKTNGKIQLAALNTLGVLYVLEKGDTIQSIQDLQGATISSSGEAAVPEYVMDFILKANNVNCTINYLSEHTEVVAQAVAGNSNIIILPEPFVTTLLSKNLGFRIALNITNEFDNASRINNMNDAVLSMGCLVVNTEFAANNKEAVNAFLAEYKTSVEYVNANISAASELIAKYEIVGSAAIASSAIPNCNIVYIDGTEMKTSIADFYQLLFNSNPASVGNKLPSDAFYYLG